MIFSRRGFLRSQMLTASAVLLGSNPLEAQMTESMEEGDWLWFPPGPMNFKTTGKETGGACCWVLGAIDPKAGTPFHKHTNEDEVFYILRGKFEINIGDKTMVGGPGLCVFGPRGTPHRFTNVGSDPGRLLTVFTPAGLEKWFQSLGVPVKAPSDLPQTDMAVLIPKIEDSAGNFGIILTGRPNIHAPNNRPDLFSADERVYGIDGRSNVPSGVLGLGHCFRRQPMHC